MEGNQKVGKKAKNALIHPEASVWLSAAVIWEISIKAALGRLHPFRPPENWTSQFIHEFGIHSLAISIEHAAAVRHLPHHHSDPFDRILIAQAQLENLTLVTADTQITAYDVRTKDASV